MSSHALCTLVVVNKQIKVLKNIFKVIEVTLHVTKITSHISYLTPNSANGSATRGSGITSI